MAFLGPFGAVISLSCVWTFDGEFAFKKLKVTSVLRVISLKEVEI